MPELPRKKCRLCGKLCHGKKCRDCYEKKLGSTVSELRRRRRKILE